MGIIYSVWAYLGNVTKYVDSFIFQILWRYASLFQNLKKIKVWWLTVKCRTAESWIQFLFDEIILLTMAVQVDK